MTHKNRFFFLPPTDCDLQTDYLLSQTLITGNNQNIGKTLALAVFAVCTTFYYG